MTDSTPGLFNADPSCRPEVNVTPLAAFFLSGLRIQEANDEAGDAGDSSNFLLSLATSFSSTGGGIKIFFLLRRMVRIPVPTPITQTT
jgi:hypothetical protein